jgi:ankyrin repeat protein
LNYLPNALDETFGRILLGIDEAKRKFAQRLFQCLVVSIRPLRVEELAEILAVRFNDAAPPTFNAVWRPENAEEAVMSACSSLISIVGREGHQLVQFSHFSVKQFLISERLATAEERLSYYHILPEPSHTILAHTCLSVLLQLDEQIERDTIGHFPLVPYAARHWVDHAQFRNVSEHVQEAMERLFDSAKPHFAAWVWIYDIDRHWIEPMSKMHPTRPEAGPLYYAALTGFCSLVDHLIATRSPDVNSRGGSHTTALHAASVKGHLEAVSLLLKNGANPNARDNRGRAPLHRVSHGGQSVMVESSLEIAQLLVNSGANVNITDFEGWTPLHAAARSGCRIIAEQLVGSGASLDVRNRDQETPLHQACGNGKLEVSRFLIDRGSDINSRDKNGLIPLHTASRYGHLDIARLLLDCGSDANVRESQRWTPLHYASRYGHLDLARLLIENSADVDVHGADRWTALHFASHNGHLDIAKLLINHGANVNSRKDNQDIWKNLHGKPCLKEQKSTTLTDFKPNVHVWQL